MIDKNKHFALYDSNGKQASRKDQGKVATQIKAVEMQATGEGNGIISLLLPRSLSEEKKINDAMAKYTVKEVTVRSKSEKAELRDAIQDTAFMAQLAVLYHQENADRPTKIDAAVREFSKWITEQLNDNKIKPPAYRLTDQMYPGLIAENRSVGWWEKQIAARKSEK